MPTSRCQTEKQTEKGRKREAEKAEKSRKRTSTLLTHFTKRQKKEKAEKEGRKSKAEKGHPLYLPTLPARNAWLASSDIIESVVGHDQAFTTRGLLEEVGKLVLLIPAFLSDLTAPVIREAMESVRTIDVEQWVDAHLGISMQCCRHFLLVRV
jgi:uncharacterized membrane protein YdbT with pleckstrin-like domain